ncbi:MULTISPECIES: LysR family transcriptional regulator [Pseudomonas]|uniref:LysR family transcriptional regulator n=1 Tax=Pseudomonas luteola TaxID=47886 RepID=A0ABS0MXH2_PSELU|nr:MULTISPECIES: LysR family transcriptional regulator [Pseudomonas]MBA1250296.1 LysR family transcriptional regulator [Pseudomonas zeshuii]MBH3441415.1 LysR family transcriptional regulator [Pseudomonas luteola]RRW40336.1 LysR family transcriptional regulator [Pseudomonas luteola]
MRGSEYIELRAFAAVVEQGSFARAAAHLGMSASSLSQTIKSLETRLGARLLNRTTRSVAPSETGSRLLKRLLPTLAELDAMVLEVSAAGNEPAGRLRLNSTRVAAIHYLAPLIASFLEAYPRVQLDVVTDERLIDIVAEGYDAGIRLGERVEQDMVAVKLSGDLEMMVVASPAYLERYGIPGEPRDLKDHRCLSYRWPTDGSLYRWEFEQAGKALEVSIEGPLVVTEPEMLTRIALEGAGIAYLFGHQVKELIAEGKLIRLMEDWTPPFPGFYVYYPSRHHMAAPLRAFLNHVGAFSQ